MDEFPEERATYHGTVGEAGDARADSGVGRASGDPEVGRLRVRIDGPLAEHDRIDELTAALTDLLSAHARDPWTPLHVELDDDALLAPGSVLARTGTEAGSRGVAELVHDRVADWVAETGAASRRPDRGEAEAAE